MRTPFYNLGIQQKEFLQCARKNFNPEDRKKIIAALQFARRAHKGQRRQEGSAYIIHPIRVASIVLAEAATWDADMIVAALLHDVIEDTKVSRVQIERRFGRRAANFVQALTRKRVLRESDAEKERRKIKKISQLSRQPIEVRLIKCADILDNLRSAAEVPWWSWTPLARKKFARWHREFHEAEKFAKGVHPILHREIVRALRRFDFKRIARGLVYLHKAI